MVGLSTVEEPGVESSEFGFAGNVGALLGAGGAAVFAAPAGPADAGGSVLDELMAAYTTHR